MNERFGRSLSALILKCLPCLNNLTSFDLFSCLSAGTYVSKHNQTVTKDNNTWTSVLQLRHITKDDAGKYECRVQNRGSTFRSGFWRASTVVFITGSFPFPSPILFYFFQFSLYPALSIYPNPIQSITVPSHSIISHPILFLPFPSVPSFPTSFNSIHSIPVTPSPFQPCISISCHPNHLHIIPSLLI